MNFTDALHEIVGYVIISYKNERFPSVSFSRRVFFFLMIFILTRDYACTRRSICRCVRNRSAYLNVILDIAFKPKVDSKLRAREIDIGHIRVCKVAFMPYERG